MGKFPKQNFYILLYLPQRRDVLAKLVKISFYMFSQSFQNCSE